MKLSPPQIKLLLSGLDQLKKSLSRAVTVEKDETVREIRQKSINDIDMLTATISNKDFFEK